MDKIQKHSGEFAGALAAGNFEMTADGLLFPKQGVLASGIYYGSVNGGDDEEEGKNLLPDQSMLDMLNVYFGAGTKRPNWYLALFAGQINPAANWTAANFAATASEIVSGSQGYSNATRPAFTTAPAAANQIGNIASKAAFNIVCTTSLNVEGAALLSDSGKGSTGGVLASAARYAQPRIVYNGDVYEVGYLVSLTS
ncbi:MAG: hypothetical protein K2Y25_09345 [Pseudomonadaceae bacterium]|nr:hypothetical protein [Pseudomonadaceae bacterium]